ncbi:MAG: diacylglycerol kinase [Eggerthellaceae bacterium]|nr:diacylglycerol kinase [Eggerthellaceae bacterium]
MKVLVINNLLSGYGEGAVYDYIRSMAQDGDVIELRVTDGTTPLRQLLSDAAEFDFVVASGGDGTVAGVAYELAGSGIPIQIIPAGTANLLAMNLLLPNEPHALAKLADAQLAMDFDLGEIETQDGSRFGFSIMAGAGYDAIIMKDAAAAKRMLGEWAYFKAALTNPTPQFAHFTLEMDDKTVETEGVGVLLINFSRIQFDIAVVHENLPRDGMFDVVVMRTRDAWGLIPAFIACVLDRDGSFPDRGDGIEVYRTSAIRIQSDPPLSIQYDGEVSTYTTPFTARVIPGAARFMVTQEAINLFEPADDDGQSR